MVASRFWPLWRAVLYPLLREPEAVRMADAIYVMETIHRELILKLAPQASEKVFLLSGFAPRGGEKASVIDIPDPIRMSEEFYRNVFAMIYECVDNLVNQLKGQAG